MKPTMLDLARLSRTVSHALRHEPWLYELELDDEGWASLDALLAVLRGECPEWSNLSEADLIRMTTTSSKRRHEISGNRIRALYGHSVPSRLRKTPGVPPNLLLHGTAPETIPYIRSSGLLPMGRQYVHLSVDEVTAAEVGRRKSPQPVILRVAACDAHLHGLRFYEGNEKVWLADHVPAQFIIFAEGTDNQPVAVPKTQKDRS
jgi:putative RNA 2'-phosphotransferase